MSDAERIASNPLALNDAIVTEEDKQQLLSQYAFFVHVRGMARPLRAGDARFLLVLRQDGGRPLCARRRGPRLPHGPRTAAPLAHPACAPGQPILPQDTWIFRVRKDAGDRLDLGDVVMLHRQTAEQQAPEVEGHLPAEPCQFKALPWSSEFLGNVLEGEDPETWVWSTFLIRRAVEGPRPELDLETVYRLDGIRGRILRCDVIRYAPADTPKEQLLLRIRRWVRRRRPRAGGALHDPAWNGRELARSMRARAPGRPRRVRGCR